MAAIDRECEDCGRAFVAKSARRRFCSDLCRVRANRHPSKTGKAKRESLQPSAKKAAAKKSSAKPAGTPIASAPPLPPTYEKLADQVKESLTASNALGTIAGRAAVRVAEQIDKGGDSGSAVVSLSKELSRLRAEAILEAAPHNLDKADDLIDQVNNKLLRLLS